MMHCLRASSILLPTSALAATAACKGKAAAPATGGAKEGAAKVAATGKPSSIELTVKRAFNKPPVAIKLALPGSDFYLVATGKGPLAAEKSAWPQLMALCKGLEFAAPQK